MFQGTDSGYLRAYNKLTGERVLNLFTGSSIIAAPVTYEVDGVQYIPVQTGWGGGGLCAPHETRPVVQHGHHNRPLGVLSDASAVLLTTRSFMGLEVSVRKTSGRLRSESAMPVLIISGHSTETRTFDPVEASSL